WRLRGIGRRREGEVCVTTGLEQQRQLAVDAAPPPVGARVREAPVAVNERVTKLAVRSARQVAVAVVEPQVVGDLGTQAFGRVVVVMEVQLDLAEAAPREV